FALGRDTPGALRAFGDAGVAALTAIREIRFNVRLAAVGFYAVAVFGSGVGARGNATMTFHASNAGDSGARYAARAAASGVAIQGGFTSVAALAVAVGESFRALEGPQIPPAHHRPRPQEDQKKSRDQAAP